MDNETIVNDNMGRSNKFFTWIQTFTKKIVTVTFILFVLFQIFTLLMILMESTRGELMYLDTFITESNETFRIVIGGYIVKAACENTVKIIGSLIQSHLHTNSNEESTEEDFES